MRKTKHRRQDASPSRVRGSPGILEPRGEEAEAADAADGLPPLPPPDSDPSAGAADGDGIAESDWNADAEVMDDCPELPDSPDTGRRNRKKEKVTMR